MKASSLRVTDFLRHILEAVERVRHYTQGMSEEQFFSNQLVQDAVIRNFEIMGEAARNVERRGKDLPELREKMKLFRDVYWMRNVLTHGYFHVNLTILWNAIQEDIGKLEQEIQEIHDMLKK